MAIKTVDITNAGVVESIIPTIKDEIKPITNIPVVYRISDNSAYENVGHYLELCTFKHTTSMNYYYYCALDICRSFYDNQVYGNIRLYVSVSANNAKFHILLKKVSSSNASSMRLFYYDDGSKTHLYLYNNGGNGHGVNYVYLREYLDVLYFNLESVATFLKELPEGAVEITE